MNLLHAPHQLCSFSNLYERGTNKSEANPSFRSVLESTRQDLLEAAPQSQTRRLASWASPYLISGDAGKSASCLWLVHRAANSPQSVRRIANAWTRSAAWGMLIFGRRASPEEHLRGIQWFGRVFRGVPEGGKDRPKRVQASNRRVTERQCK
jgi:hypothetical protein